jgi:hypothetical protein
LINHITPVIIAKNAETTIESTLKSLQNFKEVVLYLNDTHDNTKIIAQKYNNVLIVDGAFNGFGPTKNNATQYTQNNWILSLDADEVLTDEFLQNLQLVNLDNNKVYEILRTNFYKQQQIKYCWGQDYIVRLYNKKMTSFCDNKVHEYIKEDNLEKTLLTGIVKHYPYNTITDFIVKLDRYSSIFAQDNVGKKSSSPTKAFFNGMYSFFRTYIIKRGFLDGYVGLVIAFSHMVTNFYKYIKLYEANKELKQ